MTEKPKSAPELSEWGKALKRYKELEAAGRLDEIEPIPDEIHERVRKVTDRIVGK